MTEKALRFNEGKARLDMVPLDALKEVANVFEAGAKKYAPNNWRKGGPLSQYLGCALRHLAAIQRGEDTDPETGCSHWAHVVTNALFAIQLGLDGKLEDDRYKQPAVDIAASPTGDPSVTCPREVARRAGFSEREQQQFVTAAEHKPTHGDFPPTYAYDVNHPRN